MNKYLSKLADYYALNDLHKNKSKSFHFAKSSTLFSLNDIDSFYSKPNIPEMIFEQQDYLKKYSFGKYKYKSEISGNGVNNKFSAGVYYKNSSQKTSVNVILVHGWRMDSLKRIDNIYLKSFMNRGYNIYHFTLPHHFNRSEPTSYFNGELMISANIDRTLLSIRQAVIDLTALLLWSKQNNQKVILIGVSLGGIITHLSSTIVSDIDVMISAFYANSIPFSIWHSIPGKYIKKDFESSGFTYDELKKYWDIIIPSNFKPAMPKENILLISGLYDKYVLAEDTDYLWEQWDRPKRLLYRSGHSGIVLCKNLIAKDSLKFIDERINNNT